MEVVMHMLKWLSVLVATMVFGLSAAQADQTIVVNFSTGELSVVADTGDVLFVTPVVLPRRDFYTLPVTGVVTNAMMGPTWSPTPNTRAQNPGRYKAYYAAFEAGNAMGHCKITVAFDRADPVLQFVRIHGHAQSADLRGRHSRGCIRMPDAVCATMVDLVAASGGETRVSFQY